MRNDNPYSSFQTADDDTSLQYLLIDFGGSVTVKGIMIAADQEFMTGGHFDVYVYQTGPELDLASSLAASAKCSV